MHDLGGSDGENCFIVLACDGIFDVMSNDEAVSQMRLHNLVCRHRYIITSPWHSHGTNVTREPW